MAHGRRDQAHRLDRVLRRVVLDVHVDVAHAGDREGGGADAVDLHAEGLQEEAEVLDHVVGGGVADQRRPPGGGPPPAARSR